MKLVIWVAAAVLGFSPLSHAQDIRNNKTLGHIFSDRAQPNISFEGPNGKIDTFRLSDRDADGILTSGEYHNYLLHSFYGLMEKGQDSISWPQIQDLVDSHMPKDAVPDMEKHSDLRLIFSMMDRNKDDHVNLVELESASFLVFGQLDKDGSGGLDNTEFAEAPARLILPLDMDREAAEQIYHKP